ncbi:hypothetical protein Tco_1131359, partial [Tanacetum coccineum]
MIGVKVGWVSRRYSNDRDYRDRSEPPPRHGRDYRDYDNKRSGYESSGRTGKAHFLIGLYKSKVLRGKFIKVSLLS